MAKPGTARIFPAIKLITWLAAGGAFMVVTLIAAAGLLFPAATPPPQANEDRYLSVLGTTIRYRIVEHDGPTIILLHSFGGSLDMWDQVMRRLTCGRIIALDLPGFGRSGRPNLAYDLEMHRQFLLAFMDELHINNSVLIGTSMGASLAAWTAAHSPRRVKALVLFAPSGYPGSMRHGRVMDMFYRPGAPNKTARILVRTKLFERLFPESLARQALGVTSSYGNSFADALVNITQPALLVWSRSDKRVPFAYSAVYRRLMPQAVFIEAPVITGHEAAEYAPDQTASLICDFANGLRKETNQAPWNMK